MKTLLFLMIFVLVVPFNAYAKDTVPKSPAEKLDLLSPKKQEVAKASAHFAIMVTRADGSPVTSFEDSDTAFLKPALTMCDAYAVDELARGSIFLPVQVAKVKLNCLIKNAAAAKSTLVFSFLSIWK